MAVAMIGPKFYAWDRNGKPLAFGKLYTYQARTNIPKATYQSEDMVVENTNPVILNGEGYANIYLDGQYKMVLKDKDENEIWTSDPVSSNKADEWVNCMFAAYVSPTQFKVAGNFLAVFNDQRKVRIGSGLSNYSYSSVNDAVYSAGETTVTIADSIVTTNIEEVCTSLVGPDSSYSAQDVGDVSKLVFASVSDMESGITVGGVKVEFKAGQILSTGVTDWKVLNTSGQVDLGNGLFAKFMNGLHVIDMGGSPDADVSGTTGTDNTQAINDALELSGAGGAVKLSPGFWGIKSNIEERTNGGRRLLSGYGQKNTHIIALTGFTSPARNYMAWFGTQTGHGSYALRCRDLTFNANNIAIGCLFVGENGQGSIRDVDFINFVKVGYRTNAATDAKIEKCEFYSVNDDCWGIVATGAGTAATQDPSGYSYSYSLNTSPSNEMKVRDCWFSGSAHCIWGNGDLFQIEGCTSQSCGQDETRDDLFVISNLPFDADDVQMNFPIAGPVIRRNWSEGGKSRYCIRVIGYENGLIEKNFIIGSSTVVNAVREGGILVEAKRTVVRNNTFYQFFTAPPTEGRLDNAAVYIVEDAFGSKQYDNAFQLTQQGNQPYEEGTADPTGDKSGLSEIFGVVEWSDPTTPTLTASSNSVLSVVHVGVGIFQVNFKYNVQSQNVPVLCTVGDSGSYTPAFVNYRWNGNSSIRISVHDQAGADLVPDKVSFMVFAQASTSTL